MTTFDEHSRDEVFRDYLRHAQAAEQWVVDQSAKLSNYTAYHVGRGQVHAMLAQAAATLLAGTPEVESEADRIRSAIAELDRQRRETEVTAERDALRGRVDELVAQGLTKYKDAGRVVAQTGSMPKHEPQTVSWEAVADAFAPAKQKHEPGTEPLCVCGHHVERHYGGPRHCGDCTCATYVPNTADLPSTAPLCTCGHHVDSHHPASGSCCGCQCRGYTPNTTEVDGWSEPEARGARFRVARFEHPWMASRTYFKVTDQLGIVAPKEFPHEWEAQAMADDLNGVTSTGTDASVETEAQSPAALDSTEPLVKAARDAMVRVGSPAGLTSNAQAAAAAVLRSLSERYSTADLTGLDALYRTSWLRTGKWLLKMATALEQHTDTPTTE